MSRASLSRFRVRSLPRGAIRCALGAAALAAVLGLLAPLSPPCAQTVPPPDVGITGLVVPTPGPIGCGPASHMLACTNVFLHAADGVLDPLVGKTVKLFGNDESSGVCNLVKVSGVQDPPPSTLEWCGAPVSGCKLKFTVCPGGLSQYWLFASLSGGYKPLLPAKGTWLLGDPAYLVALGTGGNLCHEVTFIVPPLPASSGVNVWLQAARREIGPVGPVTLTNVICLALMPVGPPCITDGGC